MAPDPGRGAVHRARLLSRAGGAAMNRRLPLLAIVIVTAGCAIPLRTLPVGVVTDVSAPIGASAQVGCTGEQHRSGKAYSLLGLVAWGDASIETARSDQFASAVFACRALRRSTIGAETCSASERSRPSCADFSFAIGRRMPCTWPSRSGAEVPAKPAGLLLHVVQGGSALP